MVWKYDIWSNDVFNLPHVTKVSIQAKKEEIYGKAGCTRL